MITVKLHELLWKYKIKGYELAKATGLSEPTISKLVRGENIDVKLSTIDKICQYLKCDLNDILELKI